MNPTLVRLFTDYTAAHRHPINRLTHKIAIPVIVFHILAMLNWVSLVDVGGVTVTLGHVAAVAAVAFYLWLHTRLGLLMAVLLAGCFPVAAVTPWEVVVVLAVLGWVIQLAGHAVWEKNRPAFLDNLLQALIGPLFFVAVVLGVWKPNYDTRRSRLSPRTVPSFAVARRTRPRPLVAASPVPPSRRQRRRDAHGFPTAGDFCLGRPTARDNPLATSVLAAIASA